MAAATIRPNRREHILDVALRLMSENGSTKTSMRELARACDINVAALYHYFESKDALLAAVIDERRYGDRLADIPPIPAEASPAERLAFVYRTVWRGALAEERVLRLLLGEGARREPAAMPVGRSLLDTLRSGLIVWLSEAIPELSVPTDAVVDMILGQLFAGLVRHIFDPDLDVGIIEASAESALVAALLPGSGPTD